MAARIVLFGATGYTGELTARELAGRGERPVLAGRSPGRVRTLAEALGGLDWALADVADPASVRALVQRGDVLVSTVGPFTRWGASALRAAVEAGAHYLDCTGEAPFIREVFETWGPRAVDAGCAMLTAMGYDWVPGNLAGALALREAGPQAVRVDVGYFTSGSAAGARVSGGTRASAAGMVLTPGHAWRGGRLVAERAGARGRSFVIGTGSRKALSAGASEPFTLPAVHPGLRDVNVYVGWFGQAADVARAVALGAALATRVPGVRAGLTAVLERLVTGSHGGPDAATRARTGSLVIAEARDGAGEVLSEVRLAGVNPYDFTAAMLAWGAHAVAAGRLRGRTGALGPVEAFGLDALAEGVRASGIRRISGGVP